MRRLARLACAASLAFTALAAEANGRFPAAQFVTLGPGARADHIALRTTFGLVVSDDAGRTWSWLCEDLFDYSGGPTWDPPLAWGGARAGVPLFVGVPDGLARSRDFCSSARVPEAMSDFTGDVTTSADGETVYWVGSNGAGPNRVLVSRDGGATFNVAGTIAEGVLPLTIEAAGMGARRVYITGVTSDATSSSRVVFLRSDDGGASLDELPIDLHGGRDAYLAGVDPTNPDVVYLRSSLPGTDAGLPGGTLLLRSSDGGRSFAEVARTAGAMYGFALSGDGRSVWIGGPEESDRLRRSDDGAMTFRRVNDVRVLCLRWHAGALYVCAPFVTEGYALARSDDGGRSLTALVRFETLSGPPTCASSTPGAVCASRWPVVRRSFVADDAGATDAAADARPVDAGAPPSPPRDACACRASATGSTPGRGCAFALSSIVLTVRRRRRARI